MKNNFEIVDDNGTIHSGTEEEMKFAFETLKESFETLKINYGYRIAKERTEKWNTEWKGDLKLIQIHEIHR